MKNVIKTIKDLKLKWIIFIITISEMILSIANVTNEKLFSKLYKAIGDKNKEIAIKLLVISGSVLLIRRAFRIVMDYYSKRVCQIKWAKLSDKIFEVSVKADVTTLQDINMNEIINVGTKSDRYVKDLIWAVHTVAGVVFDILSVSILMYATNVKLFFIVVVLLILVLIINLTLGKKFTAICDKKQKYAVKILDGFSRLKNFSIIKSFCREKYELDKISKDTEVGKDIAIKKNVIVMILGGAMNLTYCIIIITILAYGVLTGMTYYDIILFVSLLDSIFTIVQYFTDILDGFSETIAEANKTANILNLAQEKDGTIELENFNSSIEFKDVSFSYKKSENVLNKINLKISKGDKIGIYGPSGEGKSTFINLINRFFRPDSGNIYIDNININDITMESLRNKIGIVSQDIYLFDGNIEENIRYGNLKATKEDIIEAAKKANAYEFISKFKDGFDTNIGRDGIKLSGGQKQRISIARMILANPDIIILDEATSKLDNESEKIVQEAIDNYQSGKTVISIAHRLSTLDNCTYLIGINNHVIYEQGTKEELENNKNSLYYKLSHI